MYSRQIQLTEINFLEERDLFFQKREKKIKKGNDILFPRYPPVARNSNPSIRGKYVVFKNILFYLIAMIFPGYLETDNVDNAPPLRRTSLFTRQLSRVVVLRAITSREVRSVSWEIPDSSTRWIAPRSTPLDRRNDDNDVRRRREQQ